MSERPRRSALYLPANRDSAIAKARTLPCDVVILDLEDAVSPEDKAVARQMAVAAARAGGFGHRELLVRVNALSTPWGHDDVTALQSAKIDGVVVPKPSRRGDLAEFREAIGTPMPIWAMIETCRAVLGIAALTDDAAALGLAGLIMGTNDLAVELRCSVDTARLAFQSTLQLTVAAARAEGLGILDGVFNDIADADGLTQQCAQGAAFGFDGKTLIHPSQIEAANRAFSPSVAQVARAQAVVDAFALPENHGKGVLKVEGRMVELLHMREARRTLDMQSKILTAQVQRTRA